MKKLSLLLLSIFVYLFSTISLANCDQTFNLQLRYWYSYKFSDLWRNKNSYDHKLKRYRVDISEKYDRDDVPWVPHFSIPQSFKNAWYIFKARSKNTKWMEADTRYKIK